MKIALFEDHTYEMEMIYIIDMFLVIQVSGLVEIFNTGIFSDTINCYMSNFSWWYYSLSFTC